MTGKPIKRCIPADLRLYAKTKTMENPYLKSRTRLRGHEYIPGYSTDHEYFHWMAFNSSVFGKLLSGYRFIARILLTLTASRFLAAHYYKLRTVYYAYSSENHETVVRKLENRAKNDKLPTEMTQGMHQDIRRADWICLKACFRLGYINVLLLIASPLMILIGSRFHKHFTFIEIVREDGNIMHHNHAFSGAINDVFIDETEDRLLTKTSKRIISRISRTFSRFRGIDRDIMWLNCRGEAERQAFQDIWEDRYLNEDISYKSILTACERDYREKLKKVAFFVSQWVKAPDYSYSVWLTEILWNLIDGNQIQKADADIISNDLHAKYMINFFYMHGN